MHAKTHIDFSGACLLVLCSTLVGINQVVIKVVNAGMQPVFQAGLRSACAFIIVLGYAWIAKKNLSLSDGSFWPGIVAGLFFGTEFMLMFSSLEYIDVSRASVLFYTMPFWAAVAAHFLIPNDRLTPIRVLGLLLAMAGVYVALSNNNWHVDSRTLKGDIYCLVGAMLWAGIVILTRVTKFSRSGPEMQLLYQLGVSAVYLIAIAPMFGELIREMTTTIVVLFSFQVVVVVSFGFLLWFWLLSVYPASRMASFSFLSPIFGVLFGWLILGENLGQHILLSLILICFGVYLVNRKSGAQIRSQ